MKLRDHLTATDTSHEAFAERIGVSQATVTRYVQGNRLPRREIMARIVAATRGAVTADDFFDPPRRPGGSGRVAA